MLPPSSTSRHSFGGSLSFFLSFFLASLTMLAGQGFSWLRGELRGGAALAPSGERSCTRRPECAKLNAAGSPAATWHEPAHPPGPHKACFVGVPALAWGVRLAVCQAAVCTPAHLPGCGPRLCVLLAAARDHPHHQAEPAWRLQLGGVAYLYLALYT
jgi:hypothetical protein